MSEINQLENSLVALLNSIGGRERFKLLKKIGNELKKQNRQRIAKNIAPDGSAFEPRKKQNSIRQTAKMFKKMRQARHLKSAVNSGKVQIGFSGRDSIIAKIHQYGQIGKVNPNLGYAYPKRELLGISDQDQQIVNDMIINHFRGALND